MIDQLAADLRRAQKIGRKLATYSSSTPGRIRKRLLEALLKIVDADLAAFYSLGLAGGEQYVTRWEATGGSMMKKVMSNFTSPGSVTALNDTSVRDITRPSRLERTAFVEDTGLWERETFLESMPFKRLLAPVGLRHQQRLLAYHGRKFLGWVGLVRSRGAPPFTPLDRSRLQPLVQPAITALLTAERLETASQPEEAGDIVMSPAGRVLHASRIGRAWLEHCGFADRLATAVKARSRCRAKRHKIPLGSAEARIVRLDGPEGIRYLVHVQPLEELLMHPDAPLTPRQRQVAYYVAAGATVRETASALGISEETVKTHLQAVYGRLEVANRVELARALSPSQSH